jgi:glutamine synthetase
MTPPSDGRPPWAGGDMDMFQEFEDVRRYIDEQGIRMVDLKFVDLWGGWHHVTVPASQFDHQLYEGGLGFDGSSVGFKTVSSGDMVLRPDLATGAVDPFYEMPTLGFICTTLEADTKQPFPHDPRNTAARAEEYLRSTGIADSSLWGPEFEFYVFDRVSFDNGINRASYEVQSAEAEWAASNGGRGPVIPLHGGYHAMPPADRLANLRSEISLHAEAMGVPVKYHHHEVGGPGQVELEIALTGPVVAGDNGMIVKYVSKMVADRHGQTATFMPKPLFGEAGSGMHFHQHLFRDGKNLFYDPAGYGLLSETARWYIGGLLLHAPALLGLTNPSTNSYRRLVPGFEAPVRTFFSLANRSAAVRVPKYANGADTVRIEFRPPDATGNLYLSMAAQLMAGIDGIRRGIEPADHGFGPIDDNVFDYTPAQAARIGQLPVSLDAALHALALDHDFLLEGDVFSEELIERWIRVKRDRDVQAIRTRPHPYELKLYFDV